MFNTQCLASKWNSNTVISALEYLRYKLFIDIITMTNKMQIVMIYDQTTRDAGETRESRGSDPLSARVPSIQVVPLVGH